MSTCVVDDKDISHVDLWKHSVYSKLVIVLTQ